MATHYIYTLRHPVIGGVRYVGKTKKPERRRREYGFIKALPQRPVDIWVQGLLASGVTPVMTVIDEADRSTAAAIELLWIAFYEHEGCDLLNVARHTDLPGFPSRMLRRRLLPAMLQALGEKMANRRNTDTQRLTHREA